MNRYLTKDAIAVLGILAALVIGSILGIYRPQSGQLSDIRTEAAHKKSVLETDAQLVAVVPEMIRQVEAMKKQFDGRWEKKLPPRTDLGAFLREISENLAAEDMVGQLIEPGSPTKGQLYHTLPITMRFEGSFAALANFLDRMDKMERLTRIERIRIAADPRQMPVRLNVEMLMNIYFCDSQG